MPEEVVSKPATTKEAAAELGITDSQVRRLCIAGSIVGAYKQGRDWVIPRPIQRIRAGAVYIAPSGTPMPPATDTTPGKPWRQIR